MMQSVLKNVADLWRARKGLVILIVAGALVLFLAAVAPQAWATPEQRRLSATITNINGNPDPPTCVRQCDGPLIVETLDPGFGAGVDVNNVPYYITDNILWDLGVTKLADVNVHHSGKVDITDGHFDDPTQPPKHAMIWLNPAIGSFDVWFDVNKNGTFDDGDGIMGPGPTATGAGVCIDPCDVGGVTMPASNGIRPVSFALAAVIGVVVAVGAAVTWRRRRSSER
jgi:hypothetical protein